MYFLSVLILAVVFNFCACEEVCYDPCGCFNNDPPFDDRPLPESYLDQNIMWLLFTLSNPDVPIPIRWDDIASEYNASKPTVYLIHGWISNTTWQLMIKDAFIKNDHDYNVIVVDWSKGADKPLQYPFSASNTRVVGSCTGYLADNLAKQPGGSLERHACIGHSLGGQTCGYMGKFLKDGDTPRLRRITGLDPAGPLFNTNDTRVRLDKTDTIYMDVMHTDAGRQGTMLDVGHVDIYPNNGKSQPPCEVPEPPHTSGCEHNICREYYISSLNNEGRCNFTAYPCASEEDANAGLCESCDPASDCQKMGYFSYLMPGRGRFFLRTTPEDPYCEN